MTARKRLTFWGEDENDDSLACAVMDGKKSVTADTVDAYYQGYGEYGEGGYAPGDVIEVYDLRRRLRCVIRATKVYVIKFGEIPEEVWLGEGFSSALEFQECHIRCLSHLDLNEQTEFVTLHFELVEVIAR
jgi:uncharacterized protein YhfF